MIANAIQSPLLSRLLRSTRNRLWQQNAVSRLTTGCYLSAGVALVLVAVHLLVISVPALIWWVAVALPLVVRLPGALVTDRPDSVTSAKFADSWFATRELFTAAQYVNQMPASRRSDNVLQQISTSAETAAMQLLLSNAPRPRVSADPRITLAALVIALSALVTLPAVTPTATASQTGIEGLSANRPTDVDTTSWLVTTAPDAAPARPDNPSVALDRNSSDRMSSGFDEARKQQIYESIPGSTLAAAHEDLPEMAHTTTGSDQNTTSSTKSGDQSVSSPGTSSGSTPATRLEAEQGSQPLEQTIASAPVPAQTALLPLEHRSSQVTAQAGSQSRNDQAPQPNANPAPDDQFSVVTDQTSQPTRVDTTELAQQQWGPIARTLAARYAQERQP